MICMLCTAPVQMADSMQYHLCLECRMFPAPKRTPHNDQQHDQAVELTARILGGTIIEDEAE